MDTYVLNAFAKTEWKAKENQELQVMVALLTSYSSFLYSIVMEDSRFNLLSPDGVYKYDMFLEEMIGKTNGTYISSGIRLYKEYPEIGILLASIIEKGKNYIKPIFSTYLYSFLLSYTAYVLYCSGEIDTAIKHLLVNYDDMDVVDKRRLYFQVTLGRCLCSCTRLEMANSLYGYFNYEMDRQEREKQTIFKYIDSMLEFLEDAKEHIFHNDETTRGFYDILYKDGSMDAFIKNVRQENASRKLISENKFNRLIKIIEAYSNESGIWLSLLEIPKYNGDDKLPNALSKELRVRARGYIGMASEFRAFFQSVELLSILQSADMFFRHHLSKLMNNTIEENINRITELKNKYSRNATQNSNGATNITDEEFISMLDDICEELSMSLQCFGTKRNEMEAYINEIQSKFIERYYGNYNGASLIEKLPQPLRQKVMNYLVTSETVYRLLASRNDKQQLDFSAALISLTKVVEIIFNHIFSRMRVSYNSNLSDTTIKSYFDNSHNKKAHIEFGPGIFLLKDNNFCCWDGNQVVDISKLSNSYTSVGITVQTNRNNQLTTSTQYFRNSNNADDFNRRLLVKGLEYIKNNYRNVGAHTEMVSLTTMEECRDILILTENMIWILLDILK